MHTCLMILSLIGDLNRFEAIKIWAKASEKKLKEAGLTFNFRLFKNPDGEVRDACVELKIDALQMLRKRNTDSEDDFVELKNHINMLLKQWGLTLDDFKMSRIDYCHNCFVADPKDRAVIFKVLNKLPSRMMYMHRKNYYEDSIYAKSKSKNLNVYDKESERKTKLYWAKRFDDDPTPFFTKSHEKGVIRLEIQLKKEHIHYQQRKHFSRSPDAWLSRERERMYINKLQKVIPSGDFYSLDRIDEILQKSDLSKAIRTHIIEYLDCVDTFDMAVAAQKYSYNSVRRYLKELDRLGIFPVPIPDDCGIDYLPSPLWADWDKVPSTVIV